MILELVRDRKTTSFLDVILIYNQCNRKEDLKNLCLVSKVLYRVATPRLYRSLTLYIRNETNISDLTIYYLLEPSYRYLKYTREIILIAKFYKLLLYRYYNYNSSDNDTNNAESESLNDDNNTDPLGDSPEDLSRERVSRVNNRNEDP